MNQCLFQFNAFLAIVVLLFRSQEERLSWAPIATSVTLLLWLTSGFAICGLEIDVTRRYWKQLTLNALMIWGMFMFGIQPSLPDSGLLLPVSITISVLVKQARNPPLPPLLPF
ncbi:hypothetical protein FG05_30476 [Fusarium graminearum]|nr:hypothetical protein FG05_30476 [Fusarium graminearum]